jgi:protoheme IX farnesyltransferase
MELTKARLSALVLVTTAVGFVLASADPLAGWPVLAWTILGTALCAGCASALNQLWEIKRDAKMLRTRHRPLPSGAMSPMHAFAAAVIMGYSGCTTLALGANLFAAGLALLTIVLYALVYTPLKARSTTNTIVGAVCGAIPPMIGWVAASGRLDIGTWILAAILFVWQIPHFFALAWLYRADYQRGGFVMLPVLDRDGRITTRVVVLTSLMLIPLGLLATLLNVAGMFSAAASLLLGLAMLLLAVRLHITRSDADARMLFLASIAYLPLLLALMVIDRGPIAY